MPSDTSPAPDLTTAEWLVGEEASRLMEDFTDLGPTPATLTRLRKSINPRRASALLELTELRRRATEKFSRASRMFFTRKGYEQATDEWIARHKAKRLSGEQEILDVCCGVGGDLIGFSETLSATAVERDPVVALFAQHNASAYGGSPRVIVAEANKANFDSCDAWHADPDRRSVGRRTSQPELHEPTLDQLETWRGRQPDALIKFAPAARLPESWAECGELEWIARAGECRQLIAWCGALAEAPGKRRATLVSAEAPPVSFVGDPLELAPTAPGIGECVYDPSPALLAAGLDGAFAADHGLGRYSPAVPFYTGERRFTHPLLASFEVVETLPYKRKVLAEWLAERRVGRLEIKCRGVGVLPERLRKELRPRGDQGMTLLLCPAPGERRGKTVVIAARRRG